jgi:hypothetical protein
MEARNQQKQVPIAAELHIAQSALSEPQIQHYLIIVIVIIIITICHRSVFPRLHLVQIYGMIKSQFN